MIKIETQRLILKPPDESIVDALVEFYVSKRASMAGGGVSFPDAVTRSYAVLGHWSHRGYGLFSIARREDGAYVGMTGPYYPLGRPETEVGWILFDGFERKGYATEAAKAAIDYSRTTLNWDEIVHYIDAGNVQSIAVAERLGAKLDAGAVQPKPHQPCLVYRQPKR